MIDNLTDEQIHLMAQVASEYESSALSGDDSYDIELIRKGIDMIYDISDLQSPDIVICPSPMDMAIEAKLKPGETIDYLGNGYDSGWTSFYDYFERIGIKYDPECNFTTWKEFILKSGVFATVLCDNVAFVCLRPCIVKRNLSDDLHCETGPAIGWRDGYQEYALNGVWVDEELVMTPAEKIDTTILLKEKNAEVRREIVRKIGIERVCQKLGAEVLDKKDEYELINLNLGDWRKRPYLKMKNPSIAVYHLEGVPVEIKTVKAALAWRNGREDSPLILT